MNKYATLNILRGTVVVKYASNSYRMPDKLREAEIEGPIFDPSRDQQTNPLIRAMEPGIVPPKARTASHRPALTIRQLEVFHLIVQGRSNTEKLRTPLISPKVRSRFTSLHSSVNLVSIAVPPLQLPARDF